MGIDITPLESLANQTIHRCRSTNDLAKKFSEERFPHGTWISARIQDGGRGRLGRKWESEEGNLFLSMVVRVEDKSLWSWVPLTAAVGVVEFLSKLYPVIPFKVKWPNDIWISRGDFRGKLGGILCEASHHETRKDIIVGLGLNCNSSPSFECVGQITTHLSEENQSIVTAEQIRIPLANYLKGSFDRLILEGSGWVENLYSIFCLFLPGTLVQWGEPIQTGTIKSLGSSGELLVVGSSGETRSLFSEDVKIVQSVKA